MGGTRGRLPLGIMLWVVSWEVTIRNHAEGDTVGGICGCNR